MVYDVTNRDSFRGIDYWVKFARKNTYKGAIKMLIGNKCDKESEREVAYEEGEELASVHGCLFIETSAKENLNVNEGFKQLAKDMLASTTPKEDEIKVVSTKENEKDNTRDSDQVKHDTRGSLKEKIYSVCSCF